MIDKELKPKKPSVHVDRVNLSLKAVEKLKGWTEQVNPLLRGSRVSFTALTNWSLESQNDALSTAQKNDICKKLHDEVRFARWVVQELEAARKRGENLSMDDLLSRERPEIKAASTPRRPKKIKNEEHKNSDIDADNNNTTNPLPILTTK